MNKKIKDILDLKKVLIDRVSELEDIPQKYLNEVGSAAREAYRAILWHVSFHDELETLKDNEELMNLVNIPDKHPEYYKITRMFNRFVENIS